MNTNVAPNVAASFKAYRNRTVEVKSKETGLLRKPEPRMRQNDRQDQPLQSVENVCKVIEARRMELPNAKNS
jgi:hypothetical protein